VQGTQRDGEREQRRVERRDRIRARKGMTREKRKVNDETWKLTAKQFEGVPQL